MVRIERREGRREGIREGFREEKEKEKREDKKRNRSDLYTDECKVYLLQYILFTAIY